MVQIDKKIRKKEESLFSFGKVPPQAIDLEIVVLGAMMLESQCLGEVIGVLFQDAFYLESHKLIFKAILNLYDSNKSVDLLTVISQLKNNEDLEKVGGAYAVTKLTKDVVSTASVETYCRIILQQYLKREMIKISSNNISESYEDYTDAFEIYDKADNDLIQAQEMVLGGNIKDMNHYAFKVYEQYETVESTGVLGIKTNILSFDKVFCGLVAPDLIVIAARPGQGKTSFALSLTHSISVLRNVPCAWFSLEMNGTQLTRRLVSIDSGISHEKIRTGTVDESDKKRFINSIDKVSKSPVFIEDKAGINVRSIRTRANVLKRKNNIQFIVVDYLQLVHSVEPKNKNRDNIIGEITGGLKQLALELDIPVIALSQLSREVEKRGDKMPQLSDLRESGNIEQDSDEVIFLMRPEYYDFLEPVTISGVSYEVNSLCVAKGAKNRHGATCNFAMNFHKETMHFTTHFKDSPNQF